MPASRPPVKRILSNHSSSGPSCYICDMRPKPTSQQCSYDEGHMRPQGGGGGGGCQREQAGALRLTLNFPMSSSSWSAEKQAT